MNLYFCFSISLIIVSCDAPHNNLLDPENPDNKIYIIQGKIESASKTPLPLSDVLIFWQTEDKYVRTDANGLFKLQLNSLSDGWLIFDKTGYQKDSTYITPNQQKIINVSYKLNSIATLDSFFVYSIVRNKFSKPEYQIGFEVTLTDPDDEIDTVFIQNKELQISKKLQKISSKYFEGKFYDYDFDISSLEELIGKDFNVMAIAGNKNYTIGSSHIKRIINTEIETIAPKNQDTIINQSIILRWKRFEPGFSFKYSLEIYTDETEPELQWKKENISSDEISYPIEITLSPTSDNRFFWVIYCVDEFKNKSRSKPAGFLIK